MKGSGGEGEGEGEESVGSFREKKEKMKKMKKIRKKTFFFGKKRKKFYDITPSVFARDHSGPVSLSPSPSLSSLYLLRPLLSSPPLLSLSPSPSPSLLVMKN